jgi:hypothetical protein
VSIDFKDNLAAKGAVWVPFDGGYWFVHSKGLWETLRNKKNFGGDDMSFDDLIVRWCREMGVKESTATIYTICINKFRKWAKESGYKMSQENVDAWFEDEGYSAATRDQRRKIVAKFLEYARAQLSKKG